MKIDEGVMSNTDGVRSPICAILQENYQVRLITMIFIYFWIIFFDIHPINNFGYYFQWIILVVKLWRLDLLMSLIWGYFKFRHDFKLRLMMLCLLDFFTFSCFCVIKLTSWNSFESVWSSLLFPPSPLNQLKEHLVMSFFLETLMWRS